MMLEVGSVLYSEGFGCSFERYVIDRVTARRAYVKINDSGYEYVFDRDVEEGAYAKRIGGPTGYGRATYFIETPELLERYKLMYLRQKFDTIQSAKLSKQQLEQIIAIAFPEQKQEAL